MNCRTVQMETKEFNRLLKLLSRKPKEAMDALFEYYFKRIVFHLKPDIRLDRCGRCRANLFPKLIGRQRKFTLYTQSYKLGFHLLRKQRQKDNRNRFQKAHSRRNAPRRLRFERRNLRRTLRRNKKTRSAGPRYNISSVLGRLQFRGNSQDAQL